MSYASHISYTRAARCHAARGDGTSRSARKETCTSSRARSRVKNRLAERALIYYVESEKKSLFTIHLILTESVS